MLKFFNNYFEEILMVFLLSLMSVLIGLQVFMRYVMNDSLTWSEELARYAFIWATYIGVACGIKRKSHIAVEALVERFNPFYRHVASIVANLLFIVFAVLVMKEGYALTVKIFNFGQQSSAMGLPMGWVYMAPVVGFGLAIIRLLQSIAAEVRAMRTGA